MCIIYILAIPFLGICLKKTHSQQHEETYMRTLIAVLFLIEKKEKEKEN